MAADAGRPSRLFSIAFGPARLHCAFGVKRAMSPIEVISIVLSAALVVAAFVWWQHARASGIVRQGIQ